MTVPAWVKGTLLFAVTLTAGVVVGVAYERHRTPGHEAPGVDSHHLLYRFRHELGLDSAQHQAIGVILARRQRAVDSTWHALQPQVRAALDSTHQEVLGILRPDQVAKYRKMMHALHPGAGR